MRLDGYVRVSQVRGRVGDSFISPSVQRERIEAWCQAYGHELLVVHEELDESGARADRPKLGAAIERVELGQTDGIVVAKLDRFGRSLVDGLQLIERISTAGGTFVSVADGFDITTDTGRLVLRLMLSLAEFELDRVRGNWRDAQVRAVMRGVHPSAVVPFGYRRASRGEPFTIDPQTGPLVTEMFARRAEGAGPTELIRLLEQRGARTAYGREKWSLSAVKLILRNDVYLGVASSGEVRNPDAHPPLTDRATFDRAQRTGIQFPTRMERPSIIRPLLRCASCRYAMRAERRRFAGDREAWLFTCRAQGRGQASWVCHEPAAIRDDGDVETLVVEQFLEGLPAFVQHQLVGDLPDGPDLAQLEREVARQRDMWEALRDDVDAQERVGTSAYLDLLGTRQDRLAAAEEELARQRGRIPTPEKLEALVELRERWPDLTKDEQADLLAAGLRAVFVRGRSSRKGNGAPALEDRLHLAWVDRDELDLPQRGYREFVPRPFVFPERGNADERLGGTPGEFDAGEG